MRKLVAIFIILLLTLSEVFAATVTVVNPSGAIAATMAANARREHEEKYHHSTIDLGAVSNGDKVVVDKVRNPNTGKNTKFTISTKYLLTKLFTLAEIVPVALILG